MLPVLSPGWTTPTRLLSVQFCRLLQDFYFKAPSPWPSSDDEGWQGSEGSTMLAEHSHQQTLGVTDLICFPEVKEKGCWG